MKINIFQWRYSPFLMLGAFWLFSSNVHSYPLTLVECQANIRTNPINIGNNITSANASNASIDATLEYRCTPSIISGYVSICLAANGGNSSPTAINPRYMVNKTDITSTLPFRMTIQGRTWGTFETSLAYKIPTLYLPGPIGGSPTISGTIPITVSLLPKADGTVPIAGLYTNVFSGLSATLTFDADRYENSADCLTDRRETRSIEAFTIQATVVNSCEITTTNDVNLGSHPASNTNILGSRGNAIGVTCTKDAPYTIGLAPSNGNQSGAGVMSGTGSNTDKVPYQLRSTAGISGTPWGNTAISNSVGNGVKDIGNGVVQNKTVYVTVPSADFKPDNYSDTVTIHVNY